MPIERLKYFGRAAQFNLRKHLRGYVINPEPIFDSEGLAFFSSAIRNSRRAPRIREAAARTTLASRSVSKIASKFETDTIFARAVRKALPEFASDVSIFDAGYRPDP